MFSCQDRFSKPLPARHKRLDDYSVHSQTSHYGDSLCHSTDFVTVYPSGKWRLSKWEQSILSRFFYSDRVRVCVSYNFKAIKGINIKVI